MARRSRVERDDLELEALDPVTGQGLSEQDLRASTLVAARGQRADTRRAHRLRRLRLVLVVLSVACAVEATYLATTVRTTRAIERTWREVMAVDVARAEADREILETLRVFGDDDSADALLIGLGAAARGDYRRAEESLERRRIPDRRVSALRDRMIEALRFRQLQMSPGRRRLGDTPLVVVERELATQLRRWGLEPTVVPEPRLPAAEQALERVRRYADVETGTTLVLHEGGGLTTVDLDAGTVKRRAVPVPIDDLFALGRDTVVAVGPNGTIAYGLDGERDPSPRWERPGAFAVGPDGQGGIWLEERGRLLSVDAGGAAGPQAFPVPAGRTPVGSTARGVILLSSAARGQRVELWVPETGARTLLAEQATRFIGVGPTTVLLEAPLAPEEANRRTDTTRFADATRLLADTGATVRLIDLPAPIGASAERPAVETRPGATDVAVAVGPLAGRIATVLRIGASTITPVNGPRTSIGPGTLTWSPAGDYLFWVTPDGRLALHDPATRRSQVVRAPVGGVSTLVAFAAPQ